MCDSLLDKNELKNKENKYRLKFYRSPSLGHGQIDFIPPKDEVYFKEYPYKAGITKEVVYHHKMRVMETIKKYDLRKNDLVIDIGCNDGTLLNEFKKNGMRVVGIEPTNMIKYAIEREINGIQNFFNEKIAEKIIKKYGKPKIITATNVFAHMADLGAFIRGLNILMSTDTKFIFENHYILNILKNNQYDTIYHEHIRSYSITSIVHLFKMYDMQVLDAEVTKRYGGTIRVVVTKNKLIKQKKSVKLFLNKEISEGLFDKYLWSKFAINAKKNKSDLINFTKYCYEKKYKLVGKSCPGRSSTLINYCGLTKKFMPYISEQTGSHKIGKFLPGKHIPIVDDNFLYIDKPDFVIIFAWHYSKEIIKILKKNGLNSKFIIPLPFFKIVN